MTLKKGVIAIAKLLIVFFIAGMIFSSLILNFPSFLEKIGQDIFVYSSPEMQAKVMNQLSETCATLSKGNVVSYEEICNNPETLKQMKDNCREFRVIKNSGVKQENEKETEANCAKVESGEVERNCEAFKENNAAAPDLEKLGGLCKDYNEKKLNEQELFYKVIATTLSSQNIEIPGVADFSKYIAVLKFFRNLWIALPLSALLIFLIYYLSEKFDDFIGVISEILMSLGVLILLPYAIILLYKYIVGFDTTPFLSQIFGLGNVTFKAIVSVLLLMISHNYSTMILVVGFLLMGASIGIKVYLKKKPSP